MNLCLIKIFLVKNLIKTVVIVGLKVMLKGHVKNVFSRSILENSHKIYFPPKYENIEKLYLLSASSANG